MTFAVKRYWELCDTVDVKANSLGQAIEAAHALPLDNTRAEYVPGSINSDPDTDVQPITDETPRGVWPQQDTKAMKLLIIDLYGDGESLRVCEDKPAIDRIVAEYTNDEQSGEHFDEFMERKGIHLFITRQVSLEHLPTILGAETDSAIRRSNV